MTTLDGLVLYVATWPVAFVFFFFNFGNVRTFSGRVCYAFMYAVAWIPFIFAALFESFEEKS